MNSQTLLEIDARQENCCWNLEQGLIKVVGNRSNVREIILEIEARQENCCWKLKQGRRNVIGNGSNVREMILEIEARQEKKRGIHSFLNANSRAYIF